MPLTRRRGIVLGLVFICLVIAALAFAFDFLPALQAPRIVRIEPANDAREILPTSPITITFSAPMDQAQTENAFSLTPQVQGKYVWSDPYTLVFSPLARLPVSTTLTLTVSPSVHSWLQRPLPSQAVSRFTTLTRPVLVNSTPPLDARFVYVPDHVTMTFSRPLDVSLANSLTIKPQPEHFSVAPGGAAFTLYGFFEPHTSYQITVPASAVDSKYEVDLGRDYVWSFTVAAQYPNFSILNRGRVLRFGANNPISIPTQFTNVSRLDAALYAIPQQTFDENARAPFESWYAFQPAGAPLKTWSIPTNAPLDKPMQQTLALGVLAQGTYYLTVVAPEGVRDMQLLVIE